MEDLRPVREFAIKWIDKFRDQRIHYTEIVDHYLADDCKELGFQMDCGHAFEEQYGEAAGTYDGLNRIIDDVTDIKLLGSAIYSRWRYFNHWAYDAAEILLPENRAWFILALGRLAILSGDNPFIFCGELKKIHIVSNCLGYGPCPEPDEEVEQHITISANGQVHFSPYVFGNRRDGKYEKSRTEKLQIDRSTVSRIMLMFSEYFSGEYDEVFATDIGNWEMKLTNTEGKVYKFRGSLCASFVVQDKDLSDLIRESLGMPDLFVFDGNTRPDFVDRIEVHYHRNTKIKTNKPVSDSIPYAVWDYHENLIVDRQSETIEHIQSIGTGCSVHRIYKVEGGIEDLLDRLDAETLFSHIEGNPENVFMDPMETRDYEIKVFTDKGKEKTIQGTYDKKGLPDDWEDFIERVFDFISLYGWGEIMNPSVYGKLRRCDNDIIYCSVEFESGQKSYYYIADDDSIEVGDFVVVPVGWDNHEAVVEVVKKEYFTEDAVPLPKEKTKHIIRKCTEDALDLPDEQ